MSALAKLIVQSGSKPGTEIDLSYDVVTLGRAPSCQVVLDEPFASRRHAQIVFRNELYWLRDLKSKNGTYLDEVRLDGEARLDDGAEIRIGDTRLRFYDLAATRTHIAPPSDPPSMPWQMPLEVIESAREVWLAGQRLDPPLSPKQFDLLLLLWQQRGQAVSKDDIAAAVWPEAEADAVYNYQVDKMVSRVRDRLGKTFIETVWGYGYKLVIKE